MARVEGELGTGCFGDIAWEDTFYRDMREDLILYKLWYYGQSRQTKHLVDITSIVLVSGDELDTAYIESWAERKGTNTLWQEILTRIQS